MSKVPTNDNAVDSITYPCSCPKCPAVAYDRPNLNLLFGTRVINNKRIPQSWCRTCRSEERKSKEL